MNPLIVKPPVRDDYQKRRISRRLGKSEIPWDTDAAASSKKGTGNLSLSLGIFLTLALVAFTLCVALLSRPPAKVSSAIPASLPSLPAPADEKRMQEEAKLALECLGSFFSAPHDLMKLAALRPYPDLANNYQAYRGDIATLTKASPVPGGNLKRKLSFIGIPLKFTNHPARTAWVEIRGNTARLDLDSLLGIGDVLWENLRDTATGKKVSLRGYLAPIDGNENHLEFISPDRKQRIKINSIKPDNMEEECLARVTLERTAETPLRPAGWKLEKIHSWDWL